MRNFLPLTSQFSVCSICYRNADPDLAAISVGMANHIDLRNTGASLHAVFRSKELTIFFYDQYSLYVSLELNYEW